MSPTQKYGSYGALCASLVLGSVGCAHNPPPELIDARAAYRQAAGSVAMQEAPASVHTADRSLETAENAYRQDGDNQHTRDLSYVALRQAQLAEMQGKLKSDQDRITQLEAAQEQNQRNELTQLRGEYQQQQLALATSQSERQAAEARANQASQELANVASVKQDERGTVITLSGEVLFASGKADLTPSAKTKLDKVANTLSEQDPNAKIVVEGHTDAQGSQAMNLDLSTRRAQAVRDYLAGHGVASDRITAEGLGFSHPLAPNKTASGRAENRRVEIVVKPNKS